MFLALCAVAILVAVPLTGGSLSRLTSLRVRGLALLVSALALQVVVISVWPSMPHALAVVGHVGSYAMLGMVLWLNRRLPGLILVALGAGLNALTIAVNDGTLPASRAALRAAGIHLRPGFDNSGIVVHPHLAWLGDIMATPSWLPMRNMLSIGDLLLLTGACVLVVMSTRRTTPAPMRAEVVVRQLNGFVDELRRPAFRKLWLSQVSSEIGDWAARLALTTVVYERTSSATWTAVMAVSGLLPMLGPGQLLASIGDRIDRRIILVGADVVRAGVFAVIAFTNAPTPVLLLLSLLAGVATVPFEAARSAATLDVTPPERLPAVMAFGQATQSLALVVGWAVGGVLLAAIGASGAIAVNAATFAISALLLVRLPALRSKPNNETAADSKPTSTAIGRLTSAGRSIVSDELVRRAALVAVFAVGPATAVETLIVPSVGRQWHSYPWLAAVLLAAGAVADLILTLAVPTTLSPERLVRLAAWCSAGPAAVAAGLFATGSPVLGAIGFVVSAMSLSAIAPASAALAPRLPDHLRASCFTVLATALTVTQVVLSTGGGAVTDALDPAAASALLLLLPIAAGVIVLVRPMTRTLVAVNSAPAPIAAADAA